MMMATCQLKNVGTVFLISVLVQYSTCTVQYCTCTVRYRYVVLVVYPVFYDEVCRPVVKWKAVVLALVRMPEFEFSSQLR
jgi:hypothetical protein